MTGIMHSKCGLYAFHGGGKRVIIIYSFGLIIRATCYKRMHERTNIRSVQLLHSSPSHSLCFVIFHSLCLSRWSSLVTPFHTSVCRSLRRSFFYLPSSFYPPCCRWSILLLWCMGKCTAYLFPSMPKIKKIVEIDAGLKLKFVSNIY